MKSFHPGAVLLLMSTGCIVVDGSYLCDDGRCPDGLVCNASRCIAEGEGAGEGEGEGEDVLDVDWVGTWSVMVANNITCDDGFGEVNTADKSGTWLVGITSTDEGVVANVGSFYEMHGVANATRLTLIGEFPLVGTDDQEAASNSDTVTFTVDAVSSNRAEGPVSGTFSTALGLDCTINRGTVTFTR